MAIAHWAADAKKLDKTGKILKTSNLAREYGFTDLVSPLSKLMAVARVHGTMGEGPCELMTSIKAIRFFTIVPLKLTDYHI